MNQLVENFLIGEEKECAELEKAKRDALLISLGLVQECTEKKKEYLPANTLAFEAEEKGYMDCEEIEGRKRYYKWVPAVPAEPIDVTDEEYAKICAVLEKRKSLEESAAAEEIQSDIVLPSIPEYQLEVRDKTDRSFAAVCFKVFALICWIGGLFAAIGNSLLTDLHGGITFSWETFSYWSASFVAGGFTFYCFSVIASDLRDLVGGLWGLKLTNKHS